MPAGTSNVTFTSTPRRGWHNLYENSLGVQEKWFRGDVNRFANPWYFLLPNGDLYAWNGNGRGSNWLDTANRLAILGPNAWNNFERVVTDVTPVLTGPQQQVLVGLDQGHSLFRGSNDVNFLFNNLGSNEKYLRGATNSSGNTLYFLLPDGTLHEWNGSSTASGNVLALNLPNQVYADPLLLADAYADGSLLDDGTKLDPFGPNAGGPGDILP